jgi:methionyl-tRNA formyltransferase
VSQGHVANSARHRKRKLQKLRRIGLLGALNGVRMRAWYGRDLARLMPEVEPLDVAARRYGLRLERTQALNGADTIRLMREANADLGVSLGNGFIARRVFSIPRWGMINSHGELLPRFQNAQSVIWQIYEGSMETGCTIHQIDDHIDTGAILFQERIPIEFHPSLAATVSHTCVAITRAASRGIVHVVTNYEALAAAATQQTGGRSLTTPSIWQFGKMLAQHARLYTRSRVHQVRAPSGSTR